MEIGRQLILAVGLSFSLTAVADSGRAMTRRGAIYSFGDRTTLAQQVVGVQGGTLRSCLPAPFAGEVVVDIPAGALEREVTMTIELDRGHLVPRSGRWSGLGLALTADGVRAFAQPVRLTVPLVVADGEMAIGFFVEENGSLDAIDFGAPSTGKGQSAFITLRPGCFTWVLAPVQ